MTKKQVQLLGFSHGYYVAIAENPRAEIVALHGFGLSGRTFRHIAPLLNEAGISLYALDLLGFGASEKPPSGYSLQRYADLTKAFIQALALEKPALMGHSFGGLISLGTALIHEEMLGQLILLAPGGFHPLGKLNLLADFKSVDRFMKSALFQRLIKKTPLQEVMPNQDSFKAMLKLHGAHRHFDLDTMKLRKRLRTLTLPTLLLWGDNDSILPRFVDKIAQKQLPHADFKRISNARHALYYDNPHETVAAISAFLEIKQPTI